MNLLGDGLITFVDMCWNDWDMEMWDLSSQFLASIHDHTQSFSIISHWIKNFIAFTKLIYKFIISPIKIDGHPFSFQSISDLIHVA